jgi:hypothetical protein
MKTGIYKIVSRIDGKVYVGRSKNIQDRLWHHFEKLQKGKHHNRHLQSAFKKYGNENFYSEIICLCSIEELKLKEGEYISIYKSANDKFGYNIANEEHGSTYHSEETKQLARSLKDCKKVYGFDINGHFVKEWDSIKMCAKELQVNSCDVRRVIQQKQRFCKGYVLNDVNEYRMRESKRYQNYKNFKGNAVNWKVDCNGYVELSKSIT